jgi:putative endonuclease
MIGNRTEKQIIGKIGENAVCKYLESKGFKVLETNYLKKWGELDVIVRKDKKIHFVEVKSVSCEIIGENVSREMQNDVYRAEDNMHPWKLKRLGRVIQSYLLDKDISDDIEWQFDVATVMVDKARKICKVSFLEDIVL